MKTLFVTGGAGFIGSALVRYLITHTSHRVVNIDKLTYAGNLSSLSTASHSERYHFAQLDIQDTAKIQALFAQYQPDAVFHLAAESHVDRSIDSAQAFIQSNIVGTFSLLEASRHYYQQLDAAKQSDFRFIHISTDEVFGDLAESGDFFTEQTAYAPSSPYSASKAASDHLVRAWQRTYGLPTIITNCSNNYGYYHYPEKLIPLTIANALHGKPLAIYGNGEQVRDWLFVEDHVKALYQLFQHGKIGESYNIGAHQERRNLDVVQAVCSQLNLAKKQGKLTAYAANIAAIDDFSELITFVADRAGHDKRYAIDSRKIQQEIGWQSEETFDSGLAKTIEWYIAHPEWWQPLWQASH